MATRHQLVSDIILRITKGKPADDLELEPKQVGFWINMVLEGMIKDYIDIKVEDNQEVPSFFVIKESCKQIQEESYTCVEDDEERLYIQLRKPVTELFKDSGVIRVRTSEGTFVHKSRLSTIDMTESMEFSKASTKNLVYYRDGKQRLVIMGIPRELKNVVEIFVWYIPQIDIECFEDDEELPIPNDLLEELQESVEKIARRQMFGFADVENDGQDNLPNLTNA